MRFACWIIKATDMHSEYVILLFHGKNGCTKGPQCYVLHILPYCLISCHYMFTLQITTALDLGCFVTHSYFWSQPLSDFVIHCLSDYKKGFLPSEVNEPSETQGALQYSRKSTVLYPLYMNLPPGPKENQTNPVTLLPISLFRDTLQYNPSSSRSSKRYMPSCFLIKILYAFLACPIHGHLHPLSF
jgi:hypothetical protein